MVYYFMLSNREARIDAIIDGVQVPPIVLIEENKEILQDFVRNPQSDWWPVCRFGKTDAGVFASWKEAEKEYLAAEGDEIYCRMHNC